MISTLLWRCPVCKTQDSLNHEKRRFHPDLVVCSACQTQWELTRVFGGPDYKMKVISGENIGFEQPVAQWYHQMMEGLALVPIEHPGWPVQDISKPGEILYLFCPVINAYTFPADPVFQAENYLPVDGSPLPSGMVPIGPGQLAFTTERLLYFLPNKVTISLPWADLRAADTLIDVIFTIRSAERFLFFMLKGQSVLKWLAYAYLMVDLVPADEQNNIHLGYI
jgi:hypothetical protein